MMLENLTNLHSAASGFMAVPLKIEADPSPIRPPRSFSDH
jgi:hypothetical protein